MPILLGILVAASFGSGDFLGGLASRRSTMLSVLAIAQCTAFLGAIVYASVAGGNASGRDIVLGASAGGVNVLALGALYAGLATGRMGIVAPVTAIVVAFIPVLWGFATGETLSTVTLVGVIVAIAAGGLVASARDTGDRHATGRSVALAVFSGVFFGASLIIYRRPRTVPARGRCLLVERRRSSGSSSSPCSHGELCGLPNRIAAWRSQPACLT